MTVHQVIEQQVVRTPEAVAVSCRGHRLTYETLNTEANRLAHHLRRRGVGPETMVPVCLDRGVGMIVAILAILKAGGAYVPLDPDYPAERTAFTVADTAA